jgi:hypothetical protein
VATLLVAPEQGTGRGTLFEIIKGLVGDDNYAVVERAKLFGEGSQGQYNDWRAERVVAVVNELLAGETGGGFVHRRQEMYEHLKVIAEPAAVKFEVIAKFERRRTALSCASLFIATNNRNALPLPQNDRRFAVITCAPEGLHKAPDGLMERIHAAKDQAWFLSAVWHRLAELGVDWGEIMQPPHFAGRAEMIAANLSELDDVIADALAEVAGDYVAFGHLREVVKRKLAAAGMSDEPKWQSRMLNVLSVPYNPLGWVYGTKRYKVQRPDGSTILLRVIARGGDFTAIEAAGMSERAALMSQSDPAAVLARKMTERGLSVVERPE